MVDNSLRQKVDISTPCKILRFQWFTQTNLKMHYDNFETFVVEEGFARRATKEELEQSTERIKWTDRGRY